LRAYAGDDFLESPHKLVLFLDDLDIERSMITKYHRLG